MYKEILFLPDTNLNKSKHENDTSSYAVGGHLLMFSFSHYKKTQNKYITLCYPCVISNTVLTKSTITN